MCESWPETARILKSVYEKHAVRKSFTWQRTKKYVGGSHEGITVSTNMVRSMPQNSTKLSFF